MASKCECVMTHSVLGILLADPLGYAGSDCHRAVGFETILPFLAIISINSCKVGVFVEKKKMPLYRCLNTMVFCSSFGVDLFEFIKND